MAYLGIVFAYLLFPLLIEVPLSFGDEDLLRFPPRAWSLRWYEAYFGDPQWMRATALSFQVAVAASLLATFIGTMAALALERRRVRETLPMRIWADLKLQLNPTVSAVSSLLIVVTLLALGAAEWLRRRADTHNPTSRAV